MGSVGGNRLPDPGGPVCCAMITLLQLHRLLAALLEQGRYHRIHTPSHLLRELIIAGLGLTAVFVFLRDAQTGRAQHGVVKLVLLLGLANVLLPCVWCTTPRPRRRHPGRRPEVEEVTEDGNTLSLAEPGE